MIVGVQSDLDTSVQIILRFSYENPAPKYERNYRYVFRYLIYLVYFRNQFIFLYLNIHNINIIKLLVELDF